ncbi:MAG: MFS transporter, partial [Halobacteriota archaeon]
LGIEGLHLTGFEAAFGFAGLTALIGLTLVAMFVCEPGTVRDTDRRGRSRSLPSLRLDPVLALGIVTFLMAVGIAMFATIGDVVNARLEQGARMFGLQFAAFVLAHVVLQAPIGRLTDFYGRKPFLLIGAVLLIPTTAVQGFILDPWLMLGARFAQGVAGALVFTPALALAGDLAPGDGSGGTLSTLTMAFGLGIAVGPLLSGLLVSAGFHVPFVTGAALASVGVVLIALRVPEPSRQRGAV